MEESDARRNWKEIIMGSIGWPELVVILVIAVLLFGTTRLAGLGRASGRAIREFKEETRAIKDESAAAPATELPAAPQQSAPAAPVAPTAETPVAQPTDPTQQN